MSRLQLVPVNVQYLATAPAYPTLQAGDMYYDTTLSSLQVYTGSAWVASGGSVALLNAANTFTVSPQTINIASSSAAGLVINGTTSQTGNLLELRNVTGGLMFTAGNETVSYRRFSVISPSASTVPLIVTGAASQSANLQQWQDSAGTVQAKIDSTGYGLAVKRFGVNAGLTVPSTAMSYFETSGASNQGIVVRGSASQSANLQEWQTSNGTARTTVEAFGAFSINPSSVPNGYALIVRSGFASTPVVMVRGAASQTGDLQQWQNSSGTTLLRVNSDGQIQATQPTSKGLVVRAATTLTATITDAVGSGTTVTYTAANTFSAGQTVSISGVSPAAYNLSSVTIATASSTQFTVTNAATGTYVSGGTATVAQSANIQEWQYSDGGLAAYVSAGNGFYAYSSGSPLNISRAGVSEPNIAFFNGYFGTALGQFRAIGTGDGAGFRMTNSTTTNEYARFTPTGVVFGNNIGSLSALGQITSYSNSASTVGLVVRGAASQTANIQEWQNSSGTVLVAVANNGALRVNSVAGGASFALTAGSAATIGTIIRGAASQTANLTEWQDSSGNILSRINSSGSGVFNLIYAGSGATSIAGSVTARLATGATTNIGLLIQGVASQSANLTEWQSNTGVVLASINYTGALVAHAVQTGSASFAGVTWNGISNPTGVTTLPSLVVKGITSQTANLQEWQDSAGTVGFKVGSTGQIIGFNAATTAKIQIGSVDSMTYNASTGWVFTPYDSAKIAMVVKGVASQTADLQQWQNSAGSVISKVDSTGFFSMGASSSPGGVLGITASLATYRPLVIKAAASQTANLTEWQDSSGAVLNRILSDGSNYSSASTHWIGYNRTADGVANYNFTTVSGATSFQAQIARGSGYNGALQISNYGNSTILLTNGQAGSVVATVKGYASQTANLTEWQSSAGTILARVGSGGAIVTSGVGVFGSQSNTPNAQLFVLANSTSNPTTVVKAVASQSSNLQEWQDSAGTVLAKVDVSGAMFTVTAPVGTDTTQVATTEFVIDQIAASVTSSGQLDPLSISANTTLLTSKRYFVTSASALTLTLPASPALNDEIQILDASGNAATYNITVARNGNLINGGAGNLIIDTNGNWTSLLYTGSTYGWKVG